jgi:hypothetical protein
MTNVKRYIINYTKLVTQRVPEELRFDDVIALLMVLVYPVVYIYNQLIAFRDFVKYKLSITPQVVYLEKMLNDRYDDTLRRIYILDGSSYDPIFIYTEAELQPQFLYTESETAKPKTDLFTDGEVGQFTFDFVVYVPADIEFIEIEMKTRIDEYKLASKFFKIQTF